MNTQTSKHSMFPPMNNSRCRSINYSWNNRRGVGDNCIGCCAWIKNTSPTSERGSSNSSDRGKITGCGGTGGAAAATIVGTTGFTSAMICKICNLMLDFLGQQAEQQQ